MQQCYSLFVRSGPSGSTRTLGWALSWVWERSTRTTTFGPFRPDPSSYGPSQFKVSDYRSTEVKTLGIEALRGNPNRPTEKRLFFSLWISHCQLSYPTSNPHELLSLFWSTWCSTLIFNPSFIFITFSAMPMSIDWIFVSGGRNEPYAPGSCASSSLERHLKATFCDHKRKG